MPRFPLALAFLAGCFAPDYGNPAFTCGPNGECPSDYECRADGLCHRVGSPDDPADAPRPPDGAGDATPPIDGMVLANEGCPAPDGSLLVEGVSMAGTLAGAAADLTPGCFAGGADVFYRLVLDEERQVTIQLSSIAALGLTVSSADCAVALGCAGDAQAGETLAFDSLAAGTYQIGVHGEGGQVGDFSILYTTTDPIVRPENDGCSGAIALVDGVTRTGDTTVNALDDATGTCGDGPDLAYTFTVPGPDPARARITVLNAGFDPAIQVGSACLTGSIGCAQTATGGSETLDLFSLTPGTYTVWIEAVSGAPGTFDLLLQLLPAEPPPPNDTCATAEPLVSGVSASGTTLGAADDLDLACVIDGPDTVYGLSVGDVASAVLVTVQPATSWPLAAELRDAAACTTAGASCLSGGFGDLPRFFNRPSLTGDWSVIVDGAGAAAGDYTIRVDTRAEDTTFGYWIVDSTRPFVSIAGATGAVDLGIVGTDAETPLLGAADEGDYPIDLPFPFDFFGTPTTRVFADVNGFLSLATEDGAAAYVPDCPFNGSSDPFQLIAGMWGDRWAVAASKIWTRLEGSAPNRRMVIEFDDFDFLHCNPCILLGARVTEQIILYENGDIEMHYGPRSAPTRSRACGAQHLGCTATIGLRAAGPAPAADTDAYQCAQSTISEGKLITFVHPR